MQEPLKSSFCDSDSGVNDAYSDLITSSKRTLDSLLELQEVWHLKETSVPIMLAFLPFTLVFCAIRLIIEILYMCQSLWYLFTYYFYFDRHYLRRIHPLHKRQMVWHEVLHSFTYWISKCFINQVISWCLSSLHLTVFTQIVMEVYNLNFYWRLLSWNKRWAVIFYVVFGVKYFCQ